MPKSIYEINPWSILNFLCLILSLLLKYAAHKSAFNSLLLNSRITAKQSTYDKKRNKKLCSVLSLFINRTLQKNIKNINANKAAGD